MIQTKNQLMLLLSPDPIGLNILLLILRPYMMLAIHAGFLVLTSAATSLQIHSKHKITRELEADRAEKQEQLVAILERVKLLSDQLEQTSVTVADKSQTTIQEIVEMNASFKEVAVGLRTQRESEAILSIICMTLMIELS
ncbi:hypothetical protein H8B09_13100 [Paenibacillus sp. PR3]|uniref:Methyl-accepting transducer domain-containing protein n=1 Tax=Paenibacillus terricola TaxID=2763503 RepID=A0ABR8MXR1_9BACL|nr:hypothetical protein [Paenibacillus terricola]MBD3919695.1 hypothetical protein [Paenibacillus terricola]